MWSILIPAAVIAGMILMMGARPLSRTRWRVRRWRLREKADRGEHAAARLLRLVENPDRLAAALRMGIVLAASAIGLYSGVLIGGMIGGAGQEAGTPASVVAGATAVGIMLAALFFGEFLPRMIARRWPEPIACRMAQPLALYLVLADPLAACLGRTVEVIARLFGVTPASARATISHEEIKGLVWEAAQAGSFDEAEHEIFKRVFRFCERRARGLMTPRDQVVWIDVSDSPEEIRRKVLGCAHSRFPVCDQSLDNLLGIVQVKDLFRENSGGTAFRVTGHLTVPALIYEGARGPKVLEILRNSSTHTALVLDEFGSVVGILTLSDILGAVLGDVPEQGREDGEPRSIERDDGSWLLDGLLPIDDFRDLFHLTELPERDYQTLAGFVVSQLGHIPCMSESFELLGLRFEVVEMDANRVGRVLVSRMDPAAGAG